MKRRTTPVDVCGGAVGGAEVRDDDELRTALSSGAPVRANLQDIAFQILTALGAPDATGRAPELVALVDALLMYQAVDAAPLDIAHIVHAYLGGLKR